MQAEREKSELLEKLEEKEKENREINEDIRELEGLYKNNTKQFHEIQHENHIINEKLINQKEQYDRKIEEKGKYYYYFNY